MVTMVLLRPTTLLVGILDHRRVEARAGGDPLNILQEKRTAPPPDGAFAQSIARPHGVESARGRRAGGSLGVASGSSKKYKEPT